jgi:hypothetical protein
MAEFLFNHSIHQLELNQDVLPKLNKIACSALTAPLAAARVFRPV